MKKSPVPLTSRPFNPSAIQSSSNGTGPATEAHLEMPLPAKQDPELGSGQLPSDDQNSANSEPAKATVDE